MSDPEYKEFWVRALAYEAGYGVLQIVHQPCRRVVGEYTDDPETALAELVFIAQAHRCND